MNTERSTNRARATGLLAAAALICASLLSGSFGAAYAQDGPIPWLTAFPEWEYVEAVDWPVGLPVHLAIDDPNTPDVLPDYQADTTTMIPDWEPNPERGWAIFPLAGYDLKVGDRVVMTGGEFTIEHVVRNLAITGVDMGADTVAGTADPGVPLQAWVHGQPPLDVLAGEDGTWLADFTGVYDIVPGTAGRAWIITEGGNATAAEWTTPPPPPTPWLIAFPENEAVEGWEWPEGAAVYLTIDNAPEGFIRKGIAEVTSWGDPRTYVRFEFWEDYNLQVGDVVTLTDEFGTTITHKVQNLSVTVVNTKADTVAGTADAGAVVQVWPHEFDQIATVQVAAGDDGAWLAAFTDLFDLVTGTGGRSQIVVDGNATAVDWNAYQTYDIYAYNPRTGTTQQITYLANTHEFNPRWSTDGKKIVHDAWNTDWSSHGVYITNLKTGLSAPLTGAEGGSYPTWSPSDKWIAFDRGADNDYRLFIVAPTGGVPKLVRDDAFMASWAPNSQRLAFHQPSDGSIRTMDLNGGSVTIVAARGNGPAWSPDGEWIAFEADGDVWKVRVNSSGNPLGDPIQLTSSPAWEGRPTWSNNSKTIAFHAGLGQDTDIWTIPAAGGEPTWLTGAPEFGDYDPNYSFNGTYIAYASFSPAGQAARLWVAAFTYDPPAGTFGAGTHPYHFEFEWSLPEPNSWTGQGGEFVVSNGASNYDGYVLLRGPAELRGVDSPEGLVCEEVDEINPSQLTRFLIGWVPDYGEITYPEAKAHFGSITARAVWDDGVSAELVRHEIIPFRWDDWFQYVCSFTSGPPAMGLRVNYGHDWVESFYEAGHEVVITVTDSNGVEKATATVFTEPKDFWGGETGFQTAPEDWSPGPPDLQPYDWVYAQVDNGVTAQVQLGDIHGEVRFDLDSITGTIEAPWLTDPVPVECLDWGSGGEPINKEGGYVLTNGAEYYSCGWDPETEWDVQPWQDIGVGYFTPDGHWVANAFRDERWMAMWTYTPDPPAGLFEEGEHSYYYQWAYTAPVPDSGTSGPRTLTIAGDPTPIYDGFALIGPWDYMPQQAWTGSACDVVGVLHPDQPMRFVWGWVNDYSMTYEEALAHFGSFTIEVFWDLFSDGNLDGSSRLATMTDLRPFTGRPARLEYLCTLTEHP